MITTSMQRDLCLHNINITVGLVLIGQPLRTGRRRCCRNGTGSATRAATGRFARCPRKKDFHHHSLNSFCDSVAMLYCMHDRSRQSMKRSALSCQRISRVIAMLVFCLDSAFQNINVGGMPFICFLVPVVFCAFFIFLKILVAGLPGGLRFQPTRDPLKCGRRQNPFCLNNKVSLLA